MPADGVYNIKSGEFIISHMALIFGCGGDKILKNICLGFRLGRYIFEILSPPQPNMSHILNYDLPTSCFLLQFRRFLLSLGVFSSCFLPVCIIIIIISSIIKTKGRGWWERQTSNLEPDWSLELGRTSKLHIMTNVTFVKKEEELFPTNWPISGHNFDIFVTFHTICNIVLVLIGIFTVQDV